MADPQIPHLALPLRVENGAYAVYEQDTTDEVANCVESVIRYEQEYLPFLPGFGRPPVLFRQATEAIGAGIGAAVAFWEPRAEAVLTDDVLDEMTRVVRVNVSDDRG